MTIYCKMNQEEWTAVLAELNVLRAENARLREALRRCNRSFHCRADAEVAMLEVSAIASAAIESAATGAPHATPV